MAKKDKKAIRQHFNGVCLKRDRHRCAMCGPGSQVREDLDVHHVTDRHNFPNGGYVLENGISLCPECHLKAEEFHSTGTAHPGYAPEDLYNKIGSSYQKALEASQKMKI